MFSFSYTTAAYSSDDEILKLLATLQRGGDDMKRAGFLYSNVLGATHKSTPVPYALQVKEFGWSVYTCYNKSCVLIGRYSKWLRCYLLIRYLAIKIDAMKHSKWRATNH